MKLIKTLALVFGLASAGLANANTLPNSWDSPDHRPVTVQPTISVDNTGAYAPSGQNNPTSSASVGVVMTGSANNAAESSHVFKAAAGNSYFLSISTTSVGGWVCVFDSATDQGDGAVSGFTLPVNTSPFCTQVAANQTTGLSYDTVGVFSAGITIVFSTTGPDVITRSATATFHGQVK